MQMETDRNRGSGITIPEEQREHPCGAQSHFFPRVVNVPIHSEAADWGSEFRWPAGEAAGPRSPSRAPSFRTLRCKSHRVRRVSALLAMCPRGHHVQCSFGGSMASAGPGKDGHVVTWALGLCREKFLSTLS